MLDDLGGKRTGERIEILRERRGLSRPVLAGLVGMSASWLKGIERGTRLPPRLPMLVKLAEALAVSDVAVLARDQQRGRGADRKHARRAGPEDQGALVGHAVNGDWSEPLSALRWHWGEAYVVNCLGTGRWTVERRDTHETLRDQIPLGLRDQITARGRSALPASSAGSGPLPASRQGTCRRCPRRA